MADPTEDDAALHKAVIAQMRDLMAGAGPDEDVALINGILRLTAKWRSQLLAKEIAAADGRVVRQGPFAGMRYLDTTSEGALAARLVGSYESELHPHLAAFAQAGLDKIVDIGCAEGYYAVGLARLLPEAIVYAHDTDEAARKHCGELAALNGVADRVRIAGEFHGEHFADFAGPRSLFIVDIEGGERELLDPERWPALQRANIIVETHPRVTFALTQEIARRFAPSHEVRVVFQQPKATPLPHWLTGRSHLDSLLAVWEWRHYPTPWLVMRPKN